MRASAARAREKKAIEKVKSCMQEIQNHSNVQEEIKTLKQKNETLKESVAATEHEIDVLREEERFIHTKQGTHTTAPFTDDVRKACYYMLAKNVAISQVSPIIRNIMRNIAHYDIGDLPSKSQLAIMQREAGSLSRLQVGEVLLNEKHATMHTEHPRQVIIIAVYKFQPVAIHIVLVSMRLSLVQLIIISRQYSQLYLNVNGLWRKKKAASKTYLKR